MLTLGYGGNLIWTGAIKEIHLQSMAKPMICLKPNLSDLLFGYLYDRYASLENDPIFIHNPRVLFSESQQNTKPFYLRWLDLLFSFLIYPKFINRSYENLIFKWAEAKYKKGGVRLIHIDMRIHSYALSESNRRIIWKSGGHATQILAKRFGVECKSPDCELTFTSNEVCFIDALIKENKFERFIVIDPNTNQDWFGDLRSWPLGDWQNLIDILAKDFPDVKVIQVGLVNGKLLQNVIDFRGRTSFREAALLMEKSLCFLGTEGGLMHAARAVKASAIILWGGVTLPDFAGYPLNQRTICKFVSCAPCGNLGWCNNDHICMKTIEVEEVYKELCVFL